MAGGIFISYRRDDSHGTAGRLRDRLMRDPRSSHVFNRAITRAAEGCAVDGQPGRALMIVLDVELAIEANRLLQGLAIFSRVAREEQRETED